MSAPVKNTSRFTFKKEERLSRKKLIDELFERGSSFYLQPFKIIFLEKKSEVTFPAQVLISVSKRNFKRAVDRNKIKRLIREAYRMNKHSLYESLQKKNRQLIIAILYTAKTIESFPIIQQKVIMLLARLAEKNEVAEKNPS